MCNTTEITATNKSLDFQKKKFVELHTEQYKLSQTTHKSKA